MRTLLVTLRLQAPLLLTGIGNGDENSARSLDYIPGGVIRGAVIARYGLKGDISNNPVSMRLFFSGSVRYFNGYVADHLNERSLPTPASWRKPKYDDGKQKQVFDFALKDKTDDVESPQPVKEPFCRINVDGCESIKPRRVLSIHIAGQDERGEVKKSNNTVFQYEALAAGQSFIAPILINEKSDEETIKTLLPLRTALWIGGSRSAGYGWVNVANIESKDNWIEAAPQEIDGQVTVTFLSDAILRDTRGQPTLDLDSLLNAQSVKRFVRQVRVGGFNRKWQTPLPQVVAVGMGSVFVYPADQLDKLRISLKDGIGERLEEGFGRVAINLNAQSQFVWMESESKPGTYDGGLSATSKQLAQHIAQQMLIRKLDRALLATVYDKALASPPNNYQIARMRAQVRRLMADPNLPMTDLRAYLERMKETGQKAFDKAKFKLSKDRLRKWLEERVEGKDIREQLSFAEEVKVAGEKANFTEGMNRMYTLRLIDAVLRANRQKGA